MTNLESIRSEILNGRGKFEAAEMTPEHITTAVAYVYDYMRGFGSFEFMQEMWGQIHNNIKKGKAPSEQLSAGQAKGVLNVFRAEVNREIENAKAKKLQIADGVYEIGTWKFQLATQTDDAEFAAGETIISYPGKRKPWIGFGFVRGTKLQAWTRFRDDHDSQQMIAVAQLLIAGGKDLLKTA